VTEVLANGSEVTSSEGLYTVSNITEPLTITVKHSDVFWTTYGNYATEFSNVSGSTITITSKAELARLAFLVNSGDNCSGKTYLLGQDLDMSDYYWKIDNPDNRFLGTFDGQGHTISGLHTPLSGQRYAALMLTNNGTVKNLVIANSSFYGSIRAAAIVCDNRGLVENCRVESDVIVKCTAQDAFTYSGGVAATQQNQGQTGSYSASNAVTRGCYSAAQVTGNDRVGGLVGGLLSGTVEYNVSKAVVGYTAQTTRIAYVIGDKTGGTAQFNYYTSETQSSNTTDVRAYPVTLADNLQKSGFAITRATNKNFDKSELYFVTGNYEGGYVSSLKIGDEWYAPKTQQVGGFDVVFSFNVTKKVIVTGMGEDQEFEMATVENVKVNGVAPDTQDGKYYFAVSGATVITGTPVVTLYDDSDFNNHYDMSTNNEAVLYYNNDCSGNVTIKGRKLYKDGYWNTICLPFDLTISGSILAGATVKTLASSTFNDETGVLTLNFTDDQATIKAGMPYIIKWPKSNETIENPKFENVTIEFTPGNDPKIVGDKDNDPVTFGGYYFRNVYPKYNEGFRGVLYMGANNTLYYPDGSVDNFTIGAFRAVFALRDGLEAGTPATGGNVRSFVLNFGGDDVATGIRPLSGSPEGEGRAAAWYDLSGRKLDTKPAKKGVYINNGKKIVVK
jgi:hypothetical protein